MTREQVAKRLLYTIEKTPGRSVKEHAIEKFLREFEKNCLENAKRSIEALRDKAIDGTIDEEDALTALNLLVSAFEDAIEKV